MTDSPANPGPAHDPGPASAPPADLDTRLALERARVVAALSGSAWHELAQPLGGLVGVADILVADGWTREQLGIPPELVVEAVNKTLQLTRILTDLGRASDRQAAGLRGLADDLVALARSDLAQVAVTVDVPVDLPELATGSGVVRQILASLLVDRIAAMGPPRHAAGRLRIAAGPSFTIPGGVDLEIEDDGGATPPPALPGTGGVAIAQALLEPHLGAVRALAAPGLHRVTVSLAPFGRPAPGVRPDPGAAAPDPTPATPSAGRTVLVCDDEEQIRRLMTRFLERAGYEVVVADTGQEALALLEAVAVDAVLSDFWMRPMTGAELYEQAVTRHPAMASRWLILSGDPGQDGLVEFVARTGVRVLDKPTDIGRLIAAIEELASA